MLQIIIIIIIIINKAGCIIDAYSYLITKPGSYFLSGGRLN